MCQAIFARTSIMRYWDNTAQFGGENSARDFTSEKGSFSQAYFVYVKKK